MTDASNSSEPAFLDTCKADLHRYLRAAREALVWKLDGLSEYDVRRPLVPTGTNLLGLVKHLAGVEAGYFGLTFGRPVPQLPAWFGDRSDPNADLWATESETRTEIVDLYRRVQEHADATIEALPLDAAGRVPWWPADRAQVTLHRVLLHVTTETHRHTGHADIVRELVDGAAGLNATNGNLWTPAAGWPAHRERLDQAARSAG